MFEIHRDESIQLAERDHLCIHTTLRKITFEKARIETLCIIVYNAVKY